MKSTKPAAIMTTVIVMFLAIPVFAWAWGPMGGFIEREVYNTLYALTHPSGLLKTIYIVLGIGCLIFGAAVYRFVVCLPGGILGGAFGGAFGMTAGGGEIFAILGGLLGFSLGISLAWFLHQLGIFIAGAWFGYLLFSGLGAAIFNSTPGIFTFILALIAGGFAVALSNALIVVIASFVGSILILLSFGKMDNRLV